MNNIVKPNLFIVGVGKAGTFSLHEYLSQHSDIFMSPKKEPNYFGRDLRFNVPNMTEDEYLSIFQETDGSFYRGEASVSYLLSRNAADEIKDFNDEARIVIIVRNPVEVMYSRYSQNLKTGIETLKTFSEALSAEADRKKGFRVPAGVTCDDWLFYREWVRYSEQIERFLSCFPRNNVFVAVYDDLTNNPEKLYVDLTRFLGVSSEPVPQFARVNANRNVRSTFVTRVARGKIRFSREIARTLIPSRSLRRSVANLLQAMNSVEAPRKRLSRELEQRLRQELEGEISYVEGVLQRDLSHWKAEHA
ncbi:sulfotransferase [Thioalkalivibrio sp. ALMg9]|uniref:sulfotransferase family protein n=1 Tax=Thioalkalivibrio sp. ALMg9 TaxID=1266912 RepID=UPI0009DA3897|nr:sulfotransferase domain-containing protein [Thioalkalivibrio sp. ALMg9]